MIVLDTNVVSELVRANGEPSVAAWIENCAETNRYVTAITMAELLYGVELQPDGKRRRELEHRVAGALSLFAGRPLPFDAAAAIAYAEIVARRLTLGRPMAIQDGQIAAICRVHQAPLATRNTRDFEHCGIELINPWLTDPGAPSP